VLRSTRISRLSDPKERFSHPIVIRFATFVILFDPFCAAPRRDLAKRQRRPIEQVKANRLANAPVIEVLAPLLHRRGRHAPRVIHKCRQHPGLVPPGLPERCRKLMIPPKALCQRLLIHHRNAEELGRLDAEAGEVVAVARGAFGLEVGAGGLTASNFRCTFLAVVTMCYASHARFSS